MRRSLGNPAPHAVALTLLATSLLSPAQSCGEEEVEDPERNVEVKLGFAAPVDEMRHHATRVPGLTVSVRSELVGQTLRVSATIRNDSSRRYVVEWPLSCRRGGRVYLDASTAIVTRSSGHVRDRIAELFSWETWAAERDWEVAWILLEPGTQVAEEMRMTDPALECTNEEDAQAYWGRDPSQIAPFTRVMVGYEVFEFLDPGLISHETPDGSDRRRFPARTLIVGEAAVPPAVRLARKRDLANDVKRTWLVSRPTPYR